MKTVSKKSDAVSLRLIVSFTNTNNSVFKLHDLKHIYINYFQNIFKTKNYRDFGAQYSVFFSLLLL